MKRTLIIGLLLVVACGGGGGDDRDEYTYVGFGNDVRMIEIEGVRCVLADGTNGALAISCDWNER